jgi:glycosyltransferase involved in cell wall biosynthesis
MNADSNYVILRTILPSMAHLAPNTLFLVLFPDPDYGSDKWYYRPDGFTSENTNIKFIKWPYDTAMQSSVIGFDPMRFKEIDNRYGPTLYWCFQVETAPNLVCGYYTNWANISRPAIVAQHMYVVHKSFPYPIATQFTRQWAQIGGTLASNRIVYPSRHCKWLADSAFGEYLSDETMQTLDKKSRVLPFGLISGDEPISPPAEPNSTPIVLYNHRFENYKMPSRTFELLDQLRGDGHEFEIVVTQTPGQGTRKYHYDRTVYASSRDDYLDNISSPSINITNTVNETFCISALDSLMMGHLLVAPNALTFPELVPPDYPFLYDTREEQAAHMAHILDTWPDEYNKWRETLIEHSRLKFSVTDYARKYLEVLREAELIHARSRTETKKTTISAFDSLFSKMKIDKPYTLPQLGDRMRKKINAAHQSMPNRRIVREAMERNDIVLSWGNGVTLTRVWHNVNDGE